MQKIYADIVPQRPYTVTMLQMQAYIFNVFQVSITFLFLFFLFKLLRPQANARLPPGPPKFPLIGNMDKLMSAAPHCALWNLAKRYGPLMHLKLGFVPAIFVSSAEVAKEVLKTNDLVFSSRPLLTAPKILGYNCTDIAFASYGDYWREMRKICILELLSAKRVDSYRFVREQEVGLLVQSIASSSNQALSLVERMFELNHDITTRIVFGEKFEGHKRFRAVMKKATSLAGGFHIGDFFPSLGFVGVISGMTAELEKVFLETDSIAGKIIQQHIERNAANKSKQEDLVDVLLHLKDNGGLKVPLTINNIKSIILDLFLGGTENASNSVEWALAEMIKNPRIMERAQTEVRKIVGTKGKVEESDLQNLDYLKLVMKETLRLHPPVPFLVPRESIKRCTIKGYEIPAKTRTIINCWAISRDPSSWKDPELFKPERFEDVLIDFKGQNFEFIPFGAGRRICPGISFGMINMELALAALLYHFDWKLPNGMRPEDLDMNETFGLTMYKSNSLCLIPSLHFTVPN